MKRGELWIAALEPKKGSEIGKQRPVLIVQTDLLNEVGHPTALILPLSSQPQSENVLRFKVVHPALNKGPAYVLIDQVRSIDVAQRLRKKIGKLTEEEMRTVSLLLRQVLELG